MHTRNIFFIDQCPPLPTAKRSNQALIVILYCLLHFYVASEEHNIINGDVQVDIPLHFKKLDLMSCLKTVL